VAEEIEACNESNACRRVRFPRRERDMGMWMMMEVLTPCVQNRRDADVGSEVLGIGSNDGEVSAAAFSSRHRRWPYSGTRSCQAPSAI
jgi:hypothetical protein